MTGQRKFPLPKAGPPTAEVHSERPDCGAGEGQANTDPRSNSGYPAGGARSEGGRDPYGRESSPECEDPGESRRRAEKQANG